LGEGRGDQDDGQQQRSHQPSSWRPQTWRRSTGRYDPVPPLRAQADASIYGRKAWHSAIQLQPCLEDNGEPHCIAFGGLRVDDAIEEALLGVVGPGAITAAVAAERQAGQRRDQVREALLRDLEAARYGADRAFRQYDAADPANRLVAGELEARWNTALAHVAEVEGKIAAHGAAMPMPVIDPAALNGVASATPPQPM
jgi:hypothetical protein